jgi:hypothetical protein
MWLHLMVAAIPVTFVMFLARSASVQRPFLSEPYVSMDDAVAAAKSLDAKDAELGRRYLQRASQAELADWVARQRPRAGEDPAVARGLEVLDGLRSAAREPEDRETLLPTVHDPDLSRRAQLHAEFLCLHPNLEWPKSHTEPAELENASREGDAAGRASVISHTDPFFHEAVDSFLATYFHRLPVLEGSLAVGWGTHGNRTVLDVGTLASERSRRRPLRWPAPGARDVPLRFAIVGESPEPVPGVKDRYLGYPVTLQVADPAELGDVLGDVRGELRVRRGGGWDCVPSFLSTPRAPLQPLARPANAVCLLPRRALDPGADHEVVFILGGVRTIRWEFRTVDAVADVEWLVSLASMPASHRSRAALDQLHALDSRWHEALGAILRCHEDLGGDSARFGRMIRRVLGEPPLVGAQTLQQRAEQMRLNNPWVRGFVLQALSEYLAEIERRTADPAALAEESSDAAAGLGLLREALVDPDDSVRGAAVMGLSDSGTRHPGYEAELVARLGDTAAAVRSVAIVALGDLDRPTTATLGAVYDRLLDGDPDVRWDAACFAGKHEAVGADLLSALLEGVESAKPKHREEAARALRRFRADPRARAALETLREDPSFDVSRAARAALEDK